MLHYNRVSFTVEDFNDLVRLLEQKPEWRAALRRLVLSEEFLALPERIDQLREQSEKDYQRLLKAQEDSGQRISALAESIDVLRQTIAEMGSRTDQRLAGLESDVRVLKVDMGYVKGESLERKYWDRAAAYLARIASRVRPLASPELADLLETAREDGRITPGDWDQLLACDVVARGRARVDRCEVYLVAEVSWVVDASDVQRAHARAALLERATGVRSWPVVAGKSITPEARQRARQDGVWQLLEGQPVEGPDAT